MKKIFLITLLAILATHSFAKSNCATGEENCWDCGKTSNDSCTARLIGTELTISAENGAIMKDYPPTKIAPSQFVSSTPWGNDITSVNISGDIKSIGEYSFWHAQNLTSVNIPDTLTSIGTGAFTNTALKSLYIPNSVETIGSKAFKEISTLEYVTFSDHPNLTSIGEEAFRNTTGFIALPDSVEHIGKSAFQGGYNNGDAMTVLIEGNPTIEDYAFNGYGKHYILEGNDCGGYCGPIALYYTKEDGIYIYDGKYFVNGEMMITDNNGDKACKNKTQCKEILSAISTGKQLIVNGKFYASLADWAKGNYEKKRIYTVDEAEAVSGKKNAFRIRYK